MLFDETIYHQFLWISYVIIFLCYLNFFMPTTLIFNLVNGSVSIIETAHKHWKGTRESLSEMCPEQVSTMDSLVSSVHICKVFLLCIFIYLSIN